MKFVFYNISHIFVTISQALFASKNAALSFLAFLQYVECDDDSAETARLTPPMSVCTLGPGDELKWGSFESLADS